MTILGQTRKAWQAGSWGQDTAQAGTFWGVLNVSLRASNAQLGVSVLWGVPTGSLEEVIIFGVSRSGPK